jgi:hypothetical protein
MRTNFPPFEKGGPGGIATVKSHIVIARREAPWQSLQYPVTYEIASTRPSSIRLIRVCR